VEEYGIARQDTDYNTLQHTKDVICMTDNKGKNKDIFIIPYFCIDNARVIYTKKV